MEIFIFVSNPTDYQYATWLTVIKVNECIINTYNIVIHKSQLNPSLRYWIIDASILERLIYTDFELKRILDFKKEN